VPILKSTKQHRSPIVDVLELAQKFFFCPKTKEELRRGNKIHALKPTFRTSGV